MKTQSVMNIGASVVPRKVLAPWRCPHLPQQAASQLSFTHFAVRIADGGSSPHTWLSCPNNITVVNTTVGGAGGSLSSALPYHAGPLSSFSPPDQSTICLSFQGLGDIIQNTLRLSAGVSHTKHEQGRAERCCASMAPALAACMHSGLWRPALMEGSLARL
eukprot:2308187-Amphidinium_carterae.1